MYVLIFLKSCDFHKKKNTSEAEEFYWHVCNKWKTIILSLHNPDFSLSPHNVFNGCVIYANGCLAAWPGWMQTTTSSSRSNLTNCLVFPALTRHDGPHLWTMVGVGGLFVSIARIFPVCLCLNSISIFVQSHLLWRWQWLKWAHWWLECWVWQGGPPPRPRQPRCGAPSWPRQGCSRARWPAAARSAGPPPPAARCSGGCKAAIKWSCQYNIILVTLPTQYLGYLG